MKKIISFVLVLTLILNICNINSFAKNNDTKVICTNCNNDITKQKDFDPGNHIWICENCGYSIFDDTVYSGEKFPNTLWMCDGCGTWLNLQEGFTDKNLNWECLECHYINDISENNEIISNDEMLDKLKENTKNNLKNNPDYIEPSNNEYRIKGNRYVTKSDYGEKTNKKLKSNDYHYGWSLGDFYVTGYTRIIESNEGTCIFIKNPEDEIKVYFRLKQDINKLNGNDNLSIASIKNATDTDFEIKNSNFGQGTLLVFVTNEKNETEDIKQYNDYLKGVEKGANTKVETFQEGDYKFALDYSIKSKNKFPLIGDIVSPLSHYKLDFEFKIRNGNCMAYPKDIQTGVDLKDNAIVKEGFYIDLAKSKYLKTDIEYLTVESNGSQLFTDEKYNEPAKDKNEYRQEGIYLIHVSNPTTNQSVTKRICVGNDKNTIKYFNANIDKAITVEKGTENTNFDTKLLAEIDYNIYNELLNKEELKDYIIDNVQIVYISEEYIKNLNANSKENRYFGYTSKELKNMFGEKKYVFSMDNNGNTIVKEFEAYDDSEIYDKLIGDLATGAGVILVCVTASAITGGAAPAASMVLSIAAKSGAKVAISSGAFASILSGTTTILKTGDINQAKESALKSLGSGIKWGAISGALIGGVLEFNVLREAAEKSNDLAFKLSFRSRNLHTIMSSHGLSMNEVAIIQRESKYPIDVIGNFTSMEQYNICKNAKLYTKIVDGKTALIRKIDLTFKDEFGRTNFERMKEGLAALDPLTGEAYQLHHVGQNMDSTLAILTKSEHMQGGNNKIWHEFGESRIDRLEFDKIRQTFWKDMAKILSEV